MESFITETSQQKQDRRSAQQHEYDRQLMIQRYKRLYCRKCKNKNTDLCKMTMTIDNKIRCNEFSKKVEQNTIK